MKSAAYEQFIQKVMDGLEACINTKCFECPYNGTEACIMRIKEDALKAIGELDAVRVQAMERGMDK